MSSGQVTKAASHKFDYTYPIARSGEPQYAAIMRQRSGMDAGSIDMGVRDVTHLCDGDQQDVVDSAFAIYETVCGQTGKKARRDQRSSQL